MVLPLRSPAVSFARTVAMGRAVPTSSYRTFSQTFSCPAAPLKVMDTSMWGSIVPKFLRNGRESFRRTPDSPTFLIVMSLLIGSQAIHLIVLRHDHARFIRSADAKIRLLQEVIEKLQHGENVDVGKLFGTGDQTKDREWEEVLQEIEQEESLWHSKSKQHGNQDKIAGELAYAPSGEPFQNPEIPHPGSQSSVVKPLSLWSRIWNKSWSWISSRPSTEVTPADEDPGQDRPKPGAFY